MDWSLRHGHLRACVHGENKCPLDPVERVLKSSAWGPTYPGDAETGEAKALFTEGAQTLLCLAHLMQTQNPREFCCLDLRAQNGTVRIRPCVSVLIKVESSRISASGPSKGDELAGPVAQPGCKGTSGVRVIRLTWWQEPAHRPGSPSSMRHANACTWH